MTTLSSRAEVPAEQARVGRVLHGVAELAAEYLAGRMLGSSGPAGADRVVPGPTPEGVGLRIPIDPPPEGRPVEDLLEDLREALRMSVRTGHPAYCNQLFGGWDLAGLVGEWVSTVMNTTMATYEMSPVATVMERALIGKMCALAGFEGGEGILTPGGSISNLMAMLAAREEAAERRSHGATEGVAVFTSSESHYSIARAAHVLGLGRGSVFAVPIDHDGRMIPAELERAVERAGSEGRRPLFVCATAGTTVYGAYDPIGPIADIADRRGMWLHVDGAYGASALLSRRHRGLLEGVERADSLTWCPHKMMGLPIVCSAVLTRRAGVMGRSMGDAAAADYLFHDEPGAELDTGTMSLQCGRRPDAVKLWAAWQAHGDAGFARRIDRLFALAREFAQMVRERESLELVREPHGCNVLFHYVPAQLRGAEGDLRGGPERDRALDAATRRVRQKVKAEGRVMINYASVEGVATFRMVLSNLVATAADLGLYLDEIERAGGDT